jgi:mercuric ion transport protein
VSAPTPTRTERTTLSAGRGPLLAGGLAAILASTCCLGPLVLLSLGFSGAWIGNLTLLEPYRPFFIAVAASALFLAWRRIWRPASACAPGEVCAVPAVGRGYKLLFVVVTLLVLVALAFPYVAPWFY